MVREPGRTCRLALVEWTRCKVNTVVRVPGRLHISTGGQDEVQGEDNGNSAWTYLQVSAGGQDEVQGEDSGGQ